MADRYTVNIWWSKEDTTFIATCPAFKSLSAFGNTRTEALAEFEIVLKAAIEIYEEKGWAVPEATV